MLIAAASRLRRLAPAGLRRLGQGGAPHRLTDLDRAGAVWRPVVRDRVRLAIWPASWDVRSSRRLARREAVFGFSKGHQPLGPPEACPCGYGLAVLLPILDAVAVVVRVLKVAARPRTSWSAVHLRSSRRLARREAVFGSARGQRPLGPPEACSCGFGSDGHVVTSLPWRVVVLAVSLAVVAGARVARRPGCRLTSVCGQASRRVGAVSEAARRRAPACGRLRPP